MAILLMMVWLFLVDWQLLWRGWMAVCSVVAVGVGVVAECAANRRRIWLGPHHTLHLVLVYVRNEADVRRDDFYARFAEQLLLVFDQLTPKSQIRSYLYIFKLEKYKYLHWLVQFLTPNFRQIIDFIKAPKSENYFKF